MIKNYTLCLSILLLLINGAQLSAMDSGAGNGTDATAPPTATAQSEKTNCFCLEEIDLSQPHYSLECGHTFHKSCLDEHVLLSPKQLIEGKRTPVCPFCKAPITGLEVDPETDRNLQEIERLEQEAADEAEAARLQAENGLPAEEHFEEGEDLSPEDLAFLLAQRDQLNEYARRHQRNLQGAGNNPHGNGPKRPKYWWTSRQAFLAYGLLLLGAAWTYKNFAKKERKNIWQI